MTVYANNVTPFAGGAGLNLESFEEALKEHYKGGVVEDLVYKNRPLLAMMPKYSRFGGRVMPVPVMNANPQNRSATFADAQKTTDYVASSIKSFLLQRERDYSIAKIDGETLEASKGDANAFMQAATAEIDGAMSAIGRSLAGACYRDGSGVIGNTLSVVTPGPPITITLTNPESVTQFEVGMILQNPAATREGTIEAVNRSTGVLDMATGNTLIATDDLVVKGDQSKKVKGLAAWITDDAAALAADFFGIVRSVDPSRLGGLTHAGSAQPIEEALIDAASLVGREGGRPDHCFLPFDKFSELVKALGSKVNYVDAKSPANIGFRALELHAPYGTMKVIPDADCQADTAWLLQMDTWSLNSLGECPRILTHDGNKALRLAGADAIEVRIGYYANIACKAPGWNCKVDL
jgi:hypothetical protein